MEVIEEFYQLLAKEMPVADFEQLVYRTPELEIVLGEGDYLMIISSNYNSRRAFYELQKILEPYVDRGKMRKRELLNTLSTIVQGGSPDAVLSAIIDTFSLTCEGYSFFEKLAHYGMMADDDFGWDPEGKWAKMTERQKQ